MKASLSHSTSKFDNLEPKQEKEIPGGSFSWRENEYKMNCSTLRPERQGAGRMLKRTGSSSDCATELAPLVQPSLIRPRAPDGIGLRSDSFQNNLNLNGIAGQAVEIPKLSDSPKGLGKELGGEPLHFLIVDDVLMNRRMVHRLLSSYNFQISEAKDGKDCLRVVDAVEAQGGKIDVVLMDNCMPVMTGEPSYDIIH
jgi:Response regulator receiver domain